MLMKTHEVSKYSFTVIMYKKLNTAAFYLFNNSLPCKLFALQMTPTKCCIFVNYIASSGAVTLTFQPRITDSTTASETFIK